MHKGMNYINGEWKDFSHRSFYKTNPCTAAYSGGYPETPPEMVQDAIGCALRAFRFWKYESRLRRADYFDNLAQLIKRDFKTIVNLISEETGKSLNESHAEVVEAIHMIQFTFGKGREPIGHIVGSEIPGKRVRVIRKPRGVVGVIAPWNFPFAIPFWTSAPALLEGNTVIFKPSEDSPGCGQLITSLIHEAGFPSGVFNMVHGSGEVGKTIVLDDRVNTILFTGSADVGDWIQRQCYKGKICSCEMGSKSAVIAHEDADVKIAVDAAVPSFSKLSGQRCVSAGRLIVHEKILDEFTERFLEKAKSLKFGNPFEDNYDFGPLINKAAVDKVKRYNQMVRDDDQAEVLLDRENELEGSKGYYVGPFVYKTEWRNVPYLKEEVFGPHVAIIPYSGNVREACRIYNDTDYALAVGIVTESSRNQAIFEIECDAGMIYFNAGSIAAESHLPFGGDKRSGNNRPSAAGTFDTVTNKVSVTENLNDAILFPQGMK